MIAPKIPNLSKKKKKFDLLLINLFVINLSAIEYQAKWLILYLRGHSNNTWHFFGPFPPPPPPHVTFFLFFDHWFSSLICFELQNKYEGKYLWKPVLAVKQNFSPAKALKTVFQRVKKYVWHSVDPPPPRISRIIRMAPYTIGLLTFNWPSCSGLFQIKYRVCQGLWPLWISKLLQICKWNSFFCIIYKTLYLTRGNNALCVILCLCLNFFELSAAELFLRSQRSLKN